jgi:hypothetical protein
MAWIKVQVSQNVNQIPCFQDMQIQYVRIKWVQKSPIIIKNLPLAN